MKRRLEPVVLWVRLIRERYSLSLHGSALLGYLVIRFLLTLPNVSANVTGLRLIDNRRRMETRLLVSFVSPFLVRRVVPRIRWANETFLPSILTLVILRTLGNSGLKLAVARQIGSLRPFAHSARLACFPSRSRRITK